MRAANLIGQVFGWLIVEDKIGTKIQGKSTKRTLWKCKCVCGNYTEATTEDLRSGKRVSCGCRKQINGVAKRKDMIGKIYNYLLVEELVGKDNDNRLTYRCKCLRCGKTIITSGKRLRSGTTKSCGCLKEDYMLHFGDTNFNDLTGKVINYLLVESRAPTRYSKAGNQTTMWNCKCLLCGKHTTVAANCLICSAPTRSCGCLKMSNAEIVIDNELNRLNINYLYDYSFSDLISPNSNMPLRFDFALFDNNNLLQGLIEYQGEQHYQKYSNGFGDFQREVTDNMKREYCLKNNIKLFEIKFDENTVQALHKILYEIYHISYDNTVPSS